MAGLYPPIEPYETGMLDVGDGNQVYWETCGNPSGKPAVMVHGPGTGLFAEHAPRIRPGALPIGAVRPAGLRPEHAARQ